MNQAELIKDEIVRRDIKFLLHFTKEINLKSIIENGLITRDKVLSSSGFISINDEHRFDNTNGICTSISFPNYKMFYQCRNKEENIDNNWVVIGIHPSVLWEKRCEFYFSNAASRHFRYTSKEEAMSYESLLKMFGEHEKSRSSLAIPDNYTTNPQAEVIFQEDIPKSYLFAFATPNTRSNNRLKHLFPNERFVIKSELFSYRSDYLHWRKTEVLE